MFTVNRPATPAVVTPIPFAPYAAFVTAKGTKPNTATAGVTTTNLPPVFGHKVTAVIRYMGKNAWKFGEIKAVLAKMGVYPADATIRTQKQCGKDGTRGNPAQLTADQQDYLADLLVQVTAGQ